MSEFQNILKIATCLVVVLLNGVLSQNDCTTKRTCGECIREPACVWCSEPIPESGNKKLINCKSATDLTLQDWCLNNLSLINPETVETIISNKPLQLQTRPGQSAIQINPQVIDVQLRVGEEYHFDFQYGQAEDYPVDLYFLMDLSASMETHRQSLSNLGQKLADEMKKLTKNVRMGFGSFVDKRELPFVSTVPSKLESPCKLKNVPCASPYSFKNQLSLTENINSFITEVREARVSGNLDFPEGGLDALMQAMVCTKEIGWRDKARHMLVFSTDASFHVAGDGKLAGVVEPNDGLCHMTNNEYTHALQLDYPSIGHINEKAKENNMVILFTVVKNQEGIYTDLKNNIKDSEVGLLQGSSENVVDLVKKVYEGIVDSVTMTDNFDNNIEVSYYSSCTGGPSTKTNTCKNIRVGSTVNFTATIKLKKCQQDGETNKVYQIKPSALDESLTIRVTPICECECEKLESKGYVKNSINCTKGGDLKCGVCSCAPGKFGEKCECDGSSVGPYIENIEKCRRDNTSETCSGLGTCKCGQCICQPRPDTSQLIYGQFCECKNFTCDMRNGQLCSSNGNCECGECVCFPGWEGSACDCSNRKDRCIGSKGEICSGHGKCKCGKCECGEKDGHTYTGQYCEVCLSCPSQCEELRDCVECLIHKEGAFSSEQCEHNCKKHSWNIVEKLDTSEDATAALDDTQEKTCHLHDNSDCAFIFKFVFQEGFFNITAQKEKLCTPKVFVLAVVGSVIGSIILAGILLLIMWKVLTTLHDRREYAKFENERKNANWSRGENPLFRNPLQTFQNPSYGN